MVGSTLYDKAMEMRIRKCLMFVMSIVILSCKEDPIGQQAIDDIAPAPVAGVRVENIPGGAVLTYTLPPDEDLLYVKAAYNLKDDVQSEARSSVYGDTIRVLGFGNTDAREVTLVAVDRSRNESEPVSVTIHPLEPPVVTIGRSLELAADFGGITAYWQNPERAEISAVILREDHNQEYMPIETVYSSTPEGVGNLRGMDTVAYKFGAYIQDRWGNRSEVKYAGLTPLFEARFDPLKFRALALPTDEPVGFGWVMPRLWDGNLTTGFHTNIGTGRWPHWFTFDLGVEGKLSRLITYQRTGTYLYAAGNIRKFEIWGSPALDPSGGWDNWQLLGEFESIKPSDAPLGTVTAEDQAYALAGEQYAFSSSNPAVRYIRVRVTENWSGTDYLHIMEMHFYGDYRGN